MPVIRFESGANVLQFSQNISLPVSRPQEKMQVVDRTADSTTQREELAPDIYTRILFFKTMPKADYLLLQTWFDDIAEGTMNEFTFVDESGESMTVIIRSPKLDFKENPEDWFSGTLVLEVVA